MTDMEEMNEIKEENDEEKSDFKIIDNYSMNDMTSSSTVAHVSGDCHSETQDGTGHVSGDCHSETQDGTGHVSGDCHSETQDGTGQLIDLLLHDFKQEKTCDVHDEGRAEITLGSETLYDDNNSSCDNNSINSTTSTLERHIHLNNDKLQHCIECGKSFKDKKHLRQHMALVHGEKKYKCDLCDFCSSSGANLRSHHKSVHLKEKPYSCSVCDYRSSQKSHLKQHVRSVHDQVKPYKCSACDKQFGINSHLERHYRAVHCSEKPYPCDECGYSFQENSDLRKHKRTIHEGVKDFICGECGKDFAQKGHLKRHIETVHCGERPYTCGECNKSFSQKGHLRSHVHSMHEGVEHSMNESIECIDSIETLPEPCEQVPIA